LKEAIVSISFPSIYFHLLGSSEKSSIFFFQPRECLPCPKSTILQKDSQMSDPWSISITSGSGRAQRSIISIGLVAVVSVVISVSRVALCLAFAHISFSDAFQRVFIHPYLFSSLSSSILEGLGGGFGGGEGGSLLDILLGGLVETERALLSRRPESRTLEAANSVLAPAPSPEPKPRSFTATAILSKFQLVKE